MKPIPFYSSTHTNEAYTISSTHTNEAYTILQ